MNEVIYMPDGRPAPLVMSPEDAAAILCIDSPNPKETLRNYRESGRLKGTQIGRRICYQLDDIRHFLKLQREQVAR